MKLLYYFIPLFFLIGSFSCKPKMTEKITIEFSSLQLDTVGTDKSISQSDIDKALSVLQNRLKRFGMFYDEDQFIVDSTNSKRYTIMLPEIKDKDQMKKLLTTKGKMEIWEVLKLNEYPDYKKIIENDFITEKAIDRNDYFRNNFFMIRI